MNLLIYSFTVTSTQIFLIFLCTFKVIQPIKKNFACLDIDACKLCEYRFNDVYIS